MKNIILAFAALSLGMAIAPVANGATFGSPVAGDSQATRMQQTGSYTQ